MSWPSGEWGQRYPAPRQGPAEAALPDALDLAMETRNPEAASRARLIQRAWAPALAGVLIGALYLLRVDSAFYFLYGMESHGIMLAKALSQGKGFVDLSLPGHPAHVREPPLFYLMLAGLIRTFGFKMLPMKALIWAAYTASAVLSTMLFQRRTRPLIALLTALLVMSSPELFQFFSGPKSELPFMATAMGALLVMESLIDRADAQGRDRRTAFLAAAAILLCLAAVFMRTLGLAVVLGAAALLVHGRHDRPLRSRAGCAFVILAPVLLGVLLWAVRGAVVSDPAGYNYIDWFMMDLPPGSPAMMAVDFHAPLMGELPWISFTGLIYRAGRHSVLYAYSIFAQLLYPISSVPSPASYALVVISAAISVAGLYLCEKGRNKAVIFFIAVYSGAIMVWPMDDNRLLLPLLPFAGIYFARGLVESSKIAVSGLRRKKEEGSKIARPAALLIPSLIMLSLVATNVWKDIEYQRACSKLPRVQHAPGFEVRFVNAEVMKSYSLLQWTGENVEPGAVVMYHSPPPCWLVSGHECRSIPFSRDFGEVRDYIVEGGADYIVLDEWGRLFSSGPGWFVEQVLRPVTRAFPDEFDTLYRIPGTGSKVLKAR